MKRIILFIIFVSLFSCKEKKQITTHQQETSISFVSDFSKLFTESQKDSLNYKLRTFEKETTNEIAIVALDSIQGDIVTFSVNLGNEMGVGKKDNSNGLLILLVNSTRQVRITTGYGTEKILTDSICQNIIDQQMIREFKEDNFYKGINDALDEFIKLWVRE